MSISRKLKAIMEEKNLSLKELEKQLGDKYSAVYNVYYDRSKNPTRATLTALAKVLEIPIVQLLEDEKSLNDEIPYQKDDYSSEFNLDLYIDVLKTLKAVASEKAVKLTRKEIFAWAEEIYQYSMVAKKDTADITFVNWLFDKNLEK